MRRLNQRFHKKSRFFAPYLAQALRTVGAPDACALYEGLVHDLSLNLTDASALRELDEDEKTQAFDKAFFEFAPLKDALLTYIKKNRDAF